MTTVTESRTSKSLKNAQSVVFFYIVQMLVSFWSRKIFFEYLGSDILGLDETVGTLLRFLNLAELGVSSAISFFLYKPMFEKDFSTINEIVTVQGYIYRRVGAVILAGSAVLMCFFPLIFKNIQVPLWYAYAFFIANLFGALLGYYINYRYCVMTADQKDYKLTTISQSSIIGFKILLIIVLPYTHHPFLWYLGTNVASSLIWTILFAVILKKDYPWLRNSDEGGKALMKKHPGILKKTKQIFVHRIAQVVLVQLQPLILYAFSTLSAVAYYGNYVTTVGKVADILNMAFASVQSGVGSLVASGNKKRVWEVFWELVDSRMYLSTSALIVLGLVVNPFISVWLSPKYLLGNEFLFLIIAQYWIMVNKITIINFTNGHGLYQDVWAPIVETVLYLCLALLFGSMWGLNGVLLGSVLGTIPITRIWKPYFLMTRGFKRPPIRDYFIPEMKRLLLIASNVVLVVWLNNKFVDYSTMTTYGRVFGYVGVVTVVVFGAMYVEFMLFSKGFRAFSKRMTGMITSKIRR